MINAGNNRFLKVKSILFQNEDYLKRQNIPEKVISRKYSIGNENFDLAILYGDDSLVVSEDQIEVGFDLFGAAFFMLSRMEEYLLDERDNHNRFPASASLAFKHNFYKLPVVDIYSRFTKACLNKLNPEIPLLNRAVAVMPSHDLDHLSKLQNLRSVAGAVKRGLFKAASIKHSSHYLKEYLNRKNPFDQITELIKMSEAANSIASFYFLVDGKNKFDTGHFDKYKKKAEKYKNEIINAGHNIGLHPSYETGLNPDLLKEEKLKLEKWLGMDVFDSRQHYLRIKVPETWENLSKVGIKLDSSLGYSEFPGFRCGTSREFNVFDVNQKKMLDLKERPLLAMDTSLINDKSGSMADKFSEIEKIKAQIRENGGNWTFLIHNSNFFWLDEAEYFELWQSFYNI